jgi:hypothetical protein
MALQNWKVPALKGKHSISSFVVQKWTKKILEGSFLYLVVVKFSEQ